MNTVNKSMAAADSVPSHQPARVLEETTNTITVAMRADDWTVLGGDLLLRLNKGVAEALMHALEGWKDER